MEWDVRCVPPVNTLAQSLHLECLRMIVKAVPKVRYKIESIHLYYLLWYHYNNKHIPGDALAELKSFR